MIKFTYHNQKVSKPGAKEFTTQTTYTPCTALDFAEFKEIITNYNWSACEKFTNDHRNKANATQTHILAFDIDEVLPMADAIKAVQHYKHIVATSGSHQVTKNPGASNEQPACDRYRVILFTETPIIDNDTNKEYFEHYGKKLFGNAIDQSTKDISRFWYSCVDIVSENETGALLKAPPATAHLTPVAAMNTRSNLVPIIAYSPQTITKPTFVDPVGKGRLHKYVEKYLAQPWKSGEYNMMLDAICNIKKNGYTEAECIAKFEGKGEKVDTQTLNTIAALYRDETKKVDPYFNTTDPQTQSFLNSTFIVDNANERKMYQFNLNAKQDTIKEVAKGSVILKIGKNELNDRLDTADMIYDPYSTEKTLRYNTDKDCNELNIYTPPAWRHDYFFHQKKLPVVDPMPQEYQDFLHHLFNEDEESIIYVTRWMANSLKQKNIHILTLVGSIRGNGKSCLAKIMSALHGKVNCSTLSQSFLEKEFNTGILNKTFVNLDEVGIKSEKAFNSIKAYTNNTIAIEGKGVDAKTSPIFANILLTNNMSDSLMGVNPTDDRQFSVPVLTTKQLPKKPSFLNGREIDVLWEDKALIERLAHFLMGQQIFELKKNLRTKQYDRVIKSSMTEWQLLLKEDLRNTYGTQQTYSYNFIQEFFKAKNVIRAPGREKIKDALRISDFARMKQKAGGQRYIVFRHLNESMKDFVNRVKKYKAGDLPLINSDVEITANNVAVTTDATRGK